MASLRDGFHELPQRDFPRLTHFGVHHDIGSLDVPLHHHRGIEVFFFFGGRAELRVASHERPLAVGEGDVVVMAPNVEHTFGLRSRKVSFYWLGFQTGSKVHRDQMTTLERNRGWVPARDQAFDSTYVAALDGNARDLAQALKVDRFALLHDMHDLHPPLRQMAAELGTAQRFAREMIYLKVMEILTLVARRLHGASGPSPASTVACVRRFVELNYDQPLTPGILARRYAVSLAHLGREFRAVYGMTLGQCITRERVAHARASIRAGHGAGDSARMCGFATARQMRLAFKRVYGMAPRAFVAKR